MPALAKLEEVVAALDPAEQELAEEGLLTGLVIDENSPDYGRGDFLVRAIHGGDRDTGALVVGESVRVGQTMRFHVRDAGSADEDLRAALRDARGALGGRPPEGALVFSCNGRGTRMFPAPHHDAAAIAGRARPHPGRGPLLQRRDRAGRRQELRPRLHGDHGRVRRGRDVNRM